MASKHEIALKRKLGITNLKQIKTDPDVRERATEYLRQMSARKRNALIKASPVLSRALQSVFGSLADIADSCEETTRIQWQVLNQIARKKKMTSKQVCDAFTLLVNADIEKNGELWSTIREALGWSALVAITFILGRSFGNKSKVSI